MIVAEWKSGQNYNIRNENGFSTYGVTAPDAEGMTPIELLSSSLALCVSISLVKLMERDGVDPGQLSISIEAEKAADSPSRVERFVLDIQLPELLDPAYRNKLIKSAERACTIGNTLRRGAEIEIKAHPL
ncbi:OsmC family protein [Paenibacillus eucommiae]|uniref:OsmC-like protein n=1 Tax=Paenibacillus eucommiae TaxID=1355755 RepID=A0ABS4IW71_9BACL|nr:OsmC family protein [Paenibacillus eucommiae]MBP1991819.1 putative OsmC-like protein [Paenibacillus eucommiae]